MKCGDRRLYLMNVGMFIPDVIVRFEICLSSAIHNRDIIPPGFESVAKDRPTGYGEVLISTRSDPICQDIS